MTARHFMLLAVVSCAFASPPGQSQATDLSARIQAADRSSSIDEDGLKPWHLKLSVQLFNPKGTPSESGTVEQWWSAPGVESIVYTFPSYTSTVTRTKDGRFRTPGTGSPPYYIEYLRKQVVHPMPTGTEIAGATPDLRKVAFNKTDFDCIMLDQPIKNGAHPPLGLFPTYCFEQGKEVLRITSDFGTQVTVRAALGGFQGRTIPLDLAVKAGAVQVATSHVEKLEGAAVPYAQASSIEGLVDQASELARIGGSVMAGQIVSKISPVYPEAARRNHVTGSVVFRAVIGIDGHIHELSLVSVPDPDLAIAAISAVRRWTYAPYLLNNEPVDVNTTITVNFGMNP